MTERDPGHRPPDDDEPRPVPPDDDRDVPPGDAMPESGGSLAGDDDEGDA